MQKLKFKILTLFIFLTPISGFLFFQNFAQAAPKIEINAEDLINLTNQDRQNYGLPALVKNEKLTRSAQSKAQDMIEKDYFAHESPEGITPWYWIEKQEYDYMYAGENLAIGFLTSASANQAWIDSPTHKENILNCHYQEIGISVIIGEFKGSNTTVAVQMFGSQDNKYENCENQAISPIKSVESAPIKPNLPTEPVIPVDTTPPATPFFLTPDQNLLTNQTSLKFKMKSELNTEVILYQNEKETQTAKANSNGEVEWKISEFQDGEYFFQIQARDQAGNQSKLSEPLKIVIDTQAPLVNQDQSFVMLDPQDPLNQFLVQIKTEDPDAIKAIVMSVDQIFELEKTQDGFSALVPQTDDLLLASVQDQAGNVIDFKLSFVNSITDIKPIAPLWKNFTLSIIKFYKFSSIAGFAIFLLTILGATAINFFVKHPEEAILG